jgi:hypothetical protein
MLDMAEARGASQSFTKQLFDVLFSDPVRTFWVSTVMIAISIVLELLQARLQLKEFWEIIMELLKHLFRDAGIAGIITAFLAFSIENKAADERRQVLHSIQTENKNHIKDLDNRFVNFGQLVAKNVLDGTFGSLLPTGFFQSFVEILSKASFVREFTQLEFRIVDFEEHDVEKLPILSDFILLQVELKYRVKNISKQDAAYPMRVYLENIRNSVLDRRFTIATVLTIDQERYSDGDVEKFRRTELDTVRYKVYESNINLGPGDASDVFVRFFNIKRKKDFVAWSNLHATSTFDVKFDFNKKKYVGGLAIYHPTRYGYHDDTYSCEAPRHVSIPEPSLPYITVELFWEPTSWLAELEAKVGGDQGGRNDAHQADA